MNNFPSEYPSHLDGPNTGLNTEIALAVREGWDDEPELRAQLRAKLSNLTLPDEVDLLLRAFWRPGSKLHKALASSDYLGAVALMRTYGHAFDDIYTAPIAIVAGVIKGIVERVCADASQS
jgi:hypothetical protein